MAYEKKSWKIIKNIMKRYEKFWKDIKNYEEQ